MRRLLAFAALALFATAGRGETVDLLLTAATAAELDPVLARMTAVHTETRAAWQFWSGRCAGKSVVLARTEGDPLNAVAATTLAIRHYAPKLVVTFGAARAHDPALRAGDVVISQAFAAFDGLLSAPRAIGAGTDALAWQPLPHAVMTVGGKEHYQMEFPADAAAHDTALALTTANGRPRAGVLGSANQVNREVDRITWIRERWHTSTEDDESAHIAGAALVLDTPVIGLRVVDGTPEQVAALALQFLEAAK